MASAACVVFVFIPLSDIFLIAACSILLNEAKQLQDVSTIHGDQWVAKLITWSIVGICVAAIHTVSFICFCIFTRNTAEESIKLRNARVCLCVMEVVAILLVLLAIIIPGIDQWPDSYRETDTAMYAGILFIVFNVFIVWFTARGVCRKQVPIEPNM